MANHVNRKGKEAPGSIVAFGASSIQGFCDYEKGGFVSRFTLWYCQPGNKRRVFNLGIGGNTTIDMARRIEREIGERQPELVIMMLGGNDFPRNNDKNPSVRTSISVYKKNINAIFSACKGRQILFMTSYPVVVEKTGITLETHAKYMNCAREVAQKYKAHIIDVDALLNSKVKYSFMYSDGIHFNAKGHDWLFRLLKSFFKAKWKTM